VKGASQFPTLLESFFMDRLMRQRQASPHTIASYRDTFRLLMQYAQQRLHKTPSQLTVPDMDTPFLGAFLDHLEKDRDNSARSRNVRLAALHSFFRFVALHAPEYNALAQRVLAMQSKRYARRPICFCAGRNRGLARCAGPQHLERKTRSSPVAAGRADRIARVGTYRLAL
jgi:integrase/recombinase XerD